MALCKHDAKEMIYIIKETQMAFLLQIFFFFSSFETIDILMKVKLLCHVVCFHLHLERSLTAKTEVKLRLGKAEMCIVDKRATREQKPYVRIRVDLYFNDP